MKSRALLNSFRYAGQGIKAAFTGERNFRIHSVMVVIVIIFGFVFQLSVIKWSLLFLSMGFVLVSELVNTAAETLVDMITKEYSPAAKKVKDLSAGAVLISAITAALVGVAVFIEPVLQFLQSLFVR